MSQLGQVKKTLPFRAMSKQCKFTTLQGMSTRIIPQTHPNTINVQRHHPNTIQYPPKHSPGTIHALIEVNRNKLHQQTLPDIPRPSQVLFEDGWKCLLTSADVCWYVLASFVVWICLVMSEVGVGWGLWVYMSDVYGYLRCLQVSGVWRVISVLIPWMVENSYCFGIVLKSRIVFTRPNWDIKMSTYNYISWTKMVGFCHCLVL